MSKSTWKICNKENIFVSIGYFVVAKRLPMVKKTFNANSFEQLECVILVNKFPNRIGFNWDYNLGHHMPQKPNPVMLMTDFLLTSMSFWPSPKKFSDSTQQKCSFSFSCNSLHFCSAVGKFLVANTGLPNLVEPKCNFFHI